MSEEPESSPESRQVRRWPLVGLVVALVLVVAALAGTWLVPMLRGGRGAEPTAASAARPAPAPVATPAPAASEPAAPIEASPGARPRPLKKAAPSAPESPMTGELHIDSDVPGAMVFLDRKFIGNTPATAKDVPPGTHHLNVSAEGYDGYSEIVEVASGPADVKVKFKEIRLNETVNVVHKHAMGSCEGRLVADPQGIRYETTNRDDAFVLKYSDIETFEVDYLKKNLRIKKRGGKQYNFTTRAENADPLFVFHRDVDKVRQQVAGSPPVRK